MHVCTFTSQAVGLVLHVQHFEYFTEDIRRREERMMSIAAALNSCHHIECNLSPRSRLCSCLHPCHFQALTLFLKVCAFFRCHFPFLSGKVVPWVELNELWFRLARGPCSTICTPSSTINQAVQDEKEGSSASRWWWVGKCRKIEAKNLQRHLPCQSCAAALTRPWLR